jgi:hypothetical protein
VGGIDQVLRLRKGPQTHGSLTNFLLNPFQLASGTKRAHGFEDRIELAEEKERKIISMFEQPRKAARKTSITFQ